MTTSFGGMARLDTLSPRRPARRLQPGNRLLVPLIRGQSAASLLSIGDAIAAECPSRGVVLSLVEIPPRWTSMVSSAVVRSREVLRWIAASDYELGPGAIDRLSIQSRFTADPNASIHEALLETQCDVVLAEFPPINGRRRHRLNAVLRSLLRELDVNVVVARPDPASRDRGVRPRSLLVPLRGGRNAWLALSVAMALAARTQARMTLMHVYDPTHHEGLLSHERATFHKLVEAAASVEPEIVEVVSENAAVAMLDVAGDHDAVVLGAHSGPLWAGMLVEKRLLPLLNGLTRTVILTRAASDTAPAA